jgi:hypothetical protein
MKSMRQYYQREVPQGMSSCTYLGETLVPCRLLVILCMAVPRLIELRFRRRLHRWWVIGYGSIQVPEYAQDPKWGDCLTDGELRIYHILSKLARADQYIFMRGVDKHEACHLLWVRIGVQARDQPTK